MGLESFAGLSQKQEDLLSKKYCFGALALVRLVSKGGPITFSAKTAQLPDSSLTSSASLQIKESKLTCRPKVYSSGTRSFQLEYEASDSLKLKGDISLPASNDPKLTFSGEYSDQGLRCKAAITNPTAIKVTATAGKDTSGFGVDGQFDLAKNRFVTYNFLKYWGGDRYRVVAKHQSLNKDKYEWGDFALSYYSTTSEKTTVAAKAVFNWPRKAAFIEFGGVYQFAKDVKVRGELNSHGVVGVGVSKEFGDRVQVSLATQVDSQKAASLGVSDYRLGTRVDINL